MDSENTEPFTDSRFGRLIALARNGDKQAIGALMSDYRNYLLLIANQELDSNIRAKMGPSDIVQQSLFAAQDKLLQFRGETETEFRGWIRKILKNDLADANRKFKVAKRRQVQLEKHLDDSQQVFTSPLDKFNTPGTDALVNEQIELLNRAIGQLSEPHQLVLQLRNWQELTFAEIGQQMDCSVDAARKLWYRAIVKLEQKYREQNPGIESSLIQSITAAGDVNETQ